VSGLLVGYTEKPRPRQLFGLFYDHFRLGLVRDIPVSVAQTYAKFSLFLSLGFSMASQPLPCTLRPVPFSNGNDAQLQTQPDTCFPPTMPPNPPSPFPPLPSKFGVDHLNNVVASGHAPIPANTAVNQGNIHSYLAYRPMLTGCRQRSHRHATRFLVLGTFGTLSFLVIQPSNFPVTIDPSFATPYSRSYTFGLQRQLSNDWVVSVELHTRIFKIFSVFGRRIWRLLRASITTPQFPL